MSPDIERQIAQILNEGGAESVHVVHDAGMWVSALIVPHPAGKRDDPNWGRLTEPFVARIEDRAAH